MRVLLLEDDVDLRRSFARRLRRDGHTVDEVATLDRARAAYREARYDCLVLDRFVPDGDALELVASLDRDGEHPPAIVVSAMGEAGHRIAGLDAGADDYLSKPVRLDELSLRVRRVAPETRTDAEGDRIALGRVVVEGARRRVTLDGVEVHLSPTQFAVLAHLATHRDRRVTTGELLGACWDLPGPGSANPLPPVVTRLRRIFGGALRITVVRDAGYTLVVEPDPSDPRDPSDPGGHGSG